MGFFLTFILVMQIIKTIDSFACNRNSFHLCDLKIDGFYDSTIVYFTDV